MLKTVLFTHDDLDGAGCRILFTLAHQHLPSDEYRILNCGVGTIDNDVSNILNSNEINEHTLICFADICPSRETLQRVVDRFPGTIIWDHHRTNLFTQWITPNAIIVPENDMGKMESGTSLMYQYFSSLAYSNTNDKRSEFYAIRGNQRLLSEFADTVRSYDTYEWKAMNNMNAKRLQILFFLLGMDRFCNRYIKRIISDTSEDLILETDLEFIDSKIEAEQKAIRNLKIEDLHIMNLRGYKAVFAMTPLGANVGDIAHHFLTEHPEFDIFITFNLYRGGEFHFRAIRDDIDLGKDIALPIGGGGHPKAAGAVITGELRNRLQDILINHLNS